MDRANNGCEQARWASKLQHITYDLQPKGYRRISTEQDIIPELKGREAKACAKVKWSGE
jgi:hypothetical protein